MQKLGKRTQGLTRRFGEKLAREAGGSSGGGGR